MNTPHALHKATLLNNGMVLITGTGETVSEPNAELYNPTTGTFAVAQSLNTPRVQHTATLLNNGMVLMAGGVDSNGNPLASAELYDPTTGTFSYTGSLNTARLVHTATLLNNGMVLMAGGCADCNPGYGQSQRGGSRAVQSCDRDLLLYRQPEHRAHATHGDAAEQRDGADGGRPGLQRRHP